VLAATRSTSCSTVAERADGREPEWRVRRDDAVLEILYGSGVG
jgi:hypothetical protein